jgi:hypothetical protein
MNPIRGTGPRSAALLFVLAVSGTTAASGQVAFPLTSVDGLDPRGVQVQPVTHRGKQGIRVVENMIGAGNAVVLLPGPPFLNGTIEVELASRVRSDAPPNMRGFIGLAFRVRDGDVLRYEAIYLRPTNARADDQLRRNHSTQYVSHPDFSWYRLREESPGVYESYVDLVPGEWTQVRIVVRGARAALHVNGSSQPVLIVRDLKGGVDAGSIALWIADGTEGFFRDLRVTREPTND